MRYRLIALDLDGTLLNRKGKMSAENARAIAAAQQAGAIVVPCTGRAWVESRMILGDYPRHASVPAVGVFVGGAAISDLNTGSTLDMAAMEPHLAMELVEHLSSRDEAVLVLRDANITGHDYFVTGSGQLNADTAWWFQYAGCRWHQKHPPTIDDMHHTMRVGLVTHPSQMHDPTTSVIEKFGDRVMLQSFAGVQRPDPAQDLHILEIFARGVDKWRGLRWLADKHDIAPQQVAVIGDEVNDLAMFQNAGCPIAMGNAIEPIKKLAKHVTLDCDQSGVAHAINQLLSGTWD